MKKRILTSLLFLCLLISLFPAAALAAVDGTENNVPYIDAETGNSKTCEQATVLTSLVSEWETGWYLCNTDTTIDTRIEVNGTVNLILGDGATLDALKGIHVPEGATLIVHGQEGGAGNLNAAGETLEGGENGYAGIGGDTSLDGEHPEVVNFGTIKLGATGTITASGGTRACGIGGGGFLHNYEEVNGKIYIYRGTVIASCSQEYYGCSIGVGADSVNKTDLMISGGVVNAENGIGSKFPYTPSGSTVSMGTFSTGENGNAMIFAETFSNITQPSDSMSMVLFQNDIGTIYGDGTIELMEKNITIPNECTLTVGEGQYLTVAEGASVINNGSIQNQGKLVVSGELINQSVLRNQGTLIVDGTLNNNAVLLNKGEAATLILSGQGAVTGGGAVYNEGGVVGEGIAVSEKTDTGVLYLDQNGVSQTTGTVTVLLDQTTWSNEETEGWYYVKNNTHLYGSVHISGEVNLILDDDATLTLDRIEIENGSSLTVYGQEKGTGILQFYNTLNGKDFSSSLILNGGVVQYIGQRFYDTPIRMGNIVINGGTMNSSISVRGEDGAITINDGTVNGMVGRDYGHIVEGTVVINGGMINADVNQEFGNINNSVICGEQVIINGGTVTANHVVEEMLPGGVYAIYGQTVSIRGGTVTATASFSDSYMTDHVFAIFGEDITITGGTVTATLVGGSGDSIYAERSFSTTDTTVEPAIIGNAVIIADGVYNKPSEEDALSGVIFEGNEGKVYGNPIVTTNFTIPSETDLTIDENRSLTVSDGAMITIEGSLNGEIIIQNGAEVKLNKDLSVSVPEGDSKITLAGKAGNDFVVTLPEEGMAVVTDGTGTAVTVTALTAGATVVPMKEEMTVSGGTTIQIGKGSAITVGEQGGSVIYDEGTVLLPENGTAVVGSSTITMPAGGGTIVSMEDGRFRLPPGATVETNGQTVIIPESGGIMSGDGTLTYSVTVTFDAQDGSAITEKTINGNTPIEQPEEPTRQGYTFLGWFTDKSGGEQWNFQSPVTEDMTLYGQWRTHTGGSSSDNRPIVSVNGVGGKASASINGTVTITPDEGYEIAEITVNGNSVAIPTDGKLVGLSRGDRVVVTFARVEDPSSLPFEDVSEQAYYYDAVVWALQNDVTMGTSATTFEPNLSCTRGQMVTFLWRAAGSPEPNNSTNPFTDVSADAYYYDAVLWAAEQGLTNGTEADTFSPNAIVTRGQMVTFLWRYDGSSVISGNSFADVPADAYYADAVAWAVHAGVTNGTGADTFSPDDDCNRGQMVTFLYRYLV